MKFLTAIVLTSVAAVSAYAGANSAPDLPPATSNAMVDVIIQFKLPATNGNLTSAGGFGHITKQFKSIRGIRMSLPARVIPLLEKLPFISYISPVRQMKSTLDVSTSTVNANLVWSYGYTGAGVGVAVIDSGVAPVDDLAGRVVYSQSFVSGLDASDAFGHGTHVAGIIGASGTDSQVPGSTRTFKGMAPGANIINLRVLDQNGAGQDADVIAAIDQAIALKNTYNIRVINLSLGRPVFESFTLDPLCLAVEAAWKAGIVVGVAAGNEGRNNSAGTNGYSTIAAPGNDPYVITVGAMKTMETPARSDDKIASYSSKGPSQIDHVIKPDLVAPGNRIISDTAGNSSYLSQTYRQNEVPKYIYAGNGNGKGDYFQLSGTSMAAPMVSGSAAVLLQKNPMLTPDQVKAILMKTASKFPQTTSVATVRSGNRAPLAFECSAPVAAGFSGRRADRRASVPSSAAMLGGCTRGHIPVGALSLRAARQCS